jgi:ribosome hibernation promoting factor
MDLKITGQHIDVGDSLRAHVVKSIKDAVSGLFANPIDGSVVFTKQRHQFFVEIALHPMKGLILQGHGEADDAYVAFDQAIDKISRQSRRYNARIKKHRNPRVADAIKSLSAQQYILQANSEDSHIEDEGQPAIIAEMFTDIDSLTVAEAVMHMDLRDQQTLVFKNKGHGGINVVYRRPDGNIGWIDPQLGAN